MTSVLPIEDLIKEFLCSCGTEGCTQTILVTKFKKHMSANELSILLHQWRDERKVDKYVDKSRGRPVTVWRATTEMLND